MLKLIRYVKRYWPIVLLGIVMLFGQAIMELNLPNLMSNIVNTGIQKSGIEEVAPRAVSADAYALMETFMSADDKQAAEGAYTAYADLDSATKASIDKTFPKAADANALVYTGGKDGQAAADGAFGRSAYALTNFLQQAAKAQGVDIGSSSMVSADFDFDRIQQMAPLLAQAPPAAIGQSVQAASTVEPTFTNAIAAVLNKAFYQALGADTGAMQTGYIIRTGLFMLLFSLFSASCAVMAGFCFSRLGAGTARDIRGDIYKKVIGFTSAEMNNFSTASLITRTTNDVTQVQMMYSMATRMMFYAPIMGIGGIFMAVRKSVGMSWIIALAVLLILCLIGVLFAVVMPRFKRVQSLIDRINLVARESLSGIMVVRAFGTQKFQQDRFDKANKDLTGNSLFIGRAITLMMPVMMMIMNGVTLFIIWVSAHQIADAKMQVGDMMAFMQYAMQIIMSFLFITMIFIMVPRASVSADRINEVLGSKSIIKDPEHPKTLGGRAKGEVAFHNVGFKYPGAEEDVLTDISFTARPGETTAFIGSTGSGKSTLVSLIPRFYDVSEGSITLDGVDIRQLSQHELRSNIGFVPQKGLLFSGDIASNLRYGDEQASDQTLRDAAEVAQATEFIDAADEGFSAPISQGGTNVSGGQRQRLSIARALVKRPPVYIFDDTFSALDFATDKRLRAALGPYTQGATVLIVAQRVSTIMTADQIVVMDDGKIVGMGSHRELLASCPAYREIAESQLSKEELA